MNKNKFYRAAGYLRLSREDGDKPESDSIISQRDIISEFISRQDELTLTDFYTDDGFTGTSFDRPGFQGMIKDILSGRINCVVVKDLSRFGRDYIESGRYLDRWFPEKGVRFISVNDGIDSVGGSYDMVVPIKNVFNAQYARDISQKVRSSFKAKQRRGDFIGAFAPYGYRKDPERRNHLIVDPDAALVVKRIFSLAGQGAGQQSIARRLNDEHIPCPSVYKSLTGQRYRNSRRMDPTVYWTYATVHRMLSNQVYLGNMEQGRNIRHVMHGHAHTLPRDEWTVVESTHEAIISTEQWIQVQTIIAHRSRQISFGEPSIFAGFLHCGDCGRAMSRRNAPSGDYYTCGSYKRYGACVCSPHRVRHSILENAVLEDVNRLISGVSGVRSIEESFLKTSNHTIHCAGDTVNAAITRLERLKKSVYEDHCDGLLTREEFVQYRADYDKQIAHLREHLSSAADETKYGSDIAEQWLSEFKKDHRICVLDRMTVAETVKDILVFEDGSVEITYLFPPPINTNQGPCNNTS